MKVVFIPSAKHQYFMQVQLEMCVAETNVCNFVVWTPHKTLILEIKGDRVSGQTMYQSNKKLGRLHITRTCNKELRDKLQTSFNTNYAIR